jgi:hypothetical protein
MRLQTHWKLLQVSPCAPSATNLDPSYDALQFLRLHHLDARSRLFSSARQSAMMH